jgi:hypothetical protein
LLQLAAALILATFWFTLQPQTANAEGMGGFYIGAALGGEYADVDYKKTVIHNFPNMELMSTYENDNGKGGIGSIKAILGHRWNLPGQTYFSGELDFAFNLNKKVDGRLKGVDDTSSPDAPDVFPGDWDLEKNYSAGFNAKLGLSPREDILGSGGSIYLVGGVKWADFTFDGGYDGMVVLPDGTTERIAGVDRKELSAWPWLVGAGVEFGSEQNRLDLRVTYSKYKFDSSSGDGLTTSTSKVDYDFEISEWGVYVGYTFATGFGLGI